MASLQQFLRLFPNDLSLLFVELSSSLADRPDAGVHGEVMTQEIRVNAGHVGGGPCEGIKVPRYDLGDLVPQLPAQGLPKFKRLAPDLPLYHTSGRLGSIFPDDLFSCYSIFPRQSGRDGTLCL